MRFRSRSALLALLSLLLCGLVAGNGYAPIGILGEVVMDGSPIVGAEVVIGDLDSDNVAVPVLTNDEGLFYSLLTVPDPSVIDIEVIINVSGELYVEVVQGAIGWQRYDVVFDLSKDSLGVPAPAPAVDPVIADGLAEDLDTVRDGEADEGLLDELDLVVEERPGPFAPVVEEPGFVPAPPGEDPGFVGRSLFWELFIVLVIVGLFFIVKLEVERHREDY